MSTRLEVIKRYLEEDPSDSFLRYGLALEYLSVNKNEEARIQFETLINDDPDYLAAYYQLGKTYELLGENAKALNSYARGIEVAKTQKNSHTAGELQSAHDALDE